MIVYHNLIIYNMSSNNLYDQLIEMARMENIQFSETQSSRATEVEAND